MDNQLTTLQIILHFVPHK